MTSSCDTQDTRIVVQSNALIEASYRLSLYEKRILLSALVQVRRDQPVDQMTWYTIYATDLAHYAQVSRNKAYEHLKEAAETLWDREIVLRSGPNGDKTTPKGEEVTKARWIQGLQYIPKHGKLNIMFAGLICPYLTELREQFTKYEIKYVAPMRSKFGPRLYELIVQYKKFGYRTLSIDEIKDMWGVDYKRINDFKRFVIDKAVKDVNDYSDMCVSYEQIYTHRRVTHLKFEFCSKKSEQSASESGHKETQTQDQQNGQNSGPAVSQGESRKNETPNQSVVNHSKVSSFINQIRLENEDKSSRYNGLTATEIAEMNGYTPIKVNE